MSKDKDTKKKKSKDFDYFKSYVEAVDAACESAAMLKNAVRNLHDIENKMGEIHAIENRADDIYHDLSYALNKAFITPLESEDLKLVGETIDDVVDAIEEVVVNFYILNITSMRTEAKEFADLIFKCCEALRNVMVEFSNFRKSKKISAYVIAINDIEEQGDRLYSKAIRRLFTTEKDPIEIIKWRRIFELMERCCDSCEDVADTIESTILKNT